MMRRTDFKMVEKVLMAVRVTLTMGRKASLVVRTAQIWAEGT